MLSKRISEVSIISLLFLLLTHLTHAQSWTELFPTGSLPTTRYQHSAVYDNTNNRMTIFGGTPQDNVTYLNDVWVLSNANGLDITTPTWAQLSPTGSTPNSRDAHTAVYDSINNRMTIFGGWTGGSLLNDVWVLSNANGLGGTPAWIQLSPIGGTPSIRRSHTAVYDVANNRMTIFGGFNGTYVNDIWVLSTANGLGGTPTWTQILPTGSVPVGREYHTAVYDSTHNRMIIFAGSPDGEQTYLNDVWVLSNANGLDSTAPAWTQLFPTGSIPKPRVRHIAVYNTVNNQMIIFGGEDGGDTYLNDAWVLSNANGLDSTTSAWTELFPTGSIPIDRIHHTAVYDATNNLMTIFGGGYYYNDSISYLNDVWVLNDVNGVSVPPPLLTKLPSLKLFKEQSLVSAFNLEDFNQGTMGTSYSVLTNFLSLSTTVGCYVTQSSYYPATTGTNTYRITNSGGSSSNNNEVKYSTYKIYKLPKVSLTAGSSWDINVANYTYNSTGLAIPPSYYNPAAISVSDSTLVSATWLGATVIHLTSLQAFSNPVEVDVIASPNVTNFGSDIDKERILVYTNLLSNSTFSTSNDTSIWMPFELAPGRTTLATQSWVSSYTDSAGTQTNGIWRFSFADGNSGVKSTPAVSTWIPMSAGQWYTVRMRVVTDTPNNSHQSFLLGYTNYPIGGIQTDIAANILFGIPTVWTWQETPMLVHGNSTSGYPQFQFKASTSGNIYIDEIQIINAAPTLVDANRYITQQHYLYGDFTEGSDTTGWGQEVYIGAGSPPEIFVNNGLVLTFTGATSGTGQEGIKWTANNGVQGPGNAFTQMVTPGRDIGVRATLSIQSGAFNSSGIILIAAYGVQTSGQQDIGISPSNLSASAGVGSLVGGTYRTVATAVNPFYQFQFGVRSDQPGILTISDVDFDRDQDDPNYGDPTLFP